MSERREFTDEQLVELLDLARRTERLAPSSAMSAPDADAPSPRPWRYERIRDAVPYDWRVLAGDDAIAEVCDWVADRADTNEGRGNAALIVRAVNAHDALVAALRALLTVANHHEADDPDDWLIVACRECVGVDAEMVAPDFRCARHAAMELLAEPTTPGRSDQ